MRVAGNDADESDLYVTPKSSPVTNSTPRLPAETSGGAFAVAARGRPPRTAPTAPTAAAFADWIFSASSLTAKLLRMSVVAKESVFPLDGC